VCSAFFNQEGDSMMTAEVKAAEESLWTDRQLARFLNVSPRHVVNLDAKAKAPGALRIGHCRRWVPSTVREWMRLGCPSRTEFESRAQGIA
jgi:hypothetical protein